MQQEKTELEMEYSLAGAILVDGACLTLIPPTFRREFFADAYAQTVYDGAKALAARNAPVEVLSIDRWAREQGRAIPTEILVQMGNTVTSTANAGYYARMVQENAQRRQMYLLIHDMERNLHKPINELVPDFKEKLEGLQLDTGNLGLVWASEVVYEPPKWLIKPYFQRGKGTLIQADPGTGKTAFLCAVAAAVSTGKGFLGLNVETPGNVLMISTEDDAGVLRGRIEASGGNLDKVMFLTNTAGLTFQSPEIEETIKKTHAKLVIFDPFQSFLGAKVDLFRANETRPVLSGLFEMCAKHDCACAIIAHLGKQTAGKSAVTQSLGSVDIPGIMRSVIHIAANPNVEGERVAVHIKSSNAAPGKAICFTIGDRGGVQFTGLRDVTLAELSAPAQGDMDYIRKDLVQVLVELAREPHPADFYSYEEVRSTSLKVLNYIPYHDSRDLLAILRKQEFTEYLRQEEGIEITCPVRKFNTRGICLRRREEQTVKTVQTVKTADTVRDNCLLPEKRVQQAPSWEDSLVDLKLPWEEEEENVPRRWQPPDPDWMQKMPDERFPWEVPA